MPSPYAAPRAPRRRRRLLWAPRPRGRGVREPAERPAARGCAVHGEPASDAVAVVRTGPGWRALLLARALLGRRRKLVALHFIVHPHRGRLRDRVSDGLDRWAVRRALRRASCSPPMSSASARGATGSGRSASRWCRGRRASSPRASSPRRRPPVRCWPAAARSATGRRCSPPRWARTGRSPWCARPRTCPRCAAGLGHHRDGSVRDRGPRARGAPGPGIGACGGHARRGGQSGSRAADGRRRRRRAGGDHRGEGAARLPRARRRPRSSSRPATRRRCAPRSTA